MQPYGDDLPCAQSDMPRKQTKKPEVTQGCNEALDLLLLQEYADKVTRTKAALEEIQAVLHEETILANFTSAQDRRTLNTAHCCLNSLRIRVEAHVNSVEQTVKQRQLSLIQNRWEHCRPEIPIPKQKCDLLAASIDGFRPVMLSTPLTNHSQAANLVSSAEGFL